MKKILLSLFILGLLVLTACGGSAPETNDQTKDMIVKIGFIAPLTGDVANYGEAAKTGADLALKEINAAGGVNGKTIELIYEDGKCNGKDASSAAQKLINVDNVDIITGTICSSETLGVAPLAEENHVLLLSVASSSPDITQAGDYIFRVWPSDIFQAKKVAEYLFKTEGIKKVGVLHTNSDYNIGLANAFKNDFENLGGSVVGVETYNQDEKDFKTQILKIKEKNPEAYYIVPYSEGGLLVKQIRELNIEEPVFASETFGTQDILDDAGAAAEGVVYATPKFDEESVTTKEFLGKYQTAYGKESPFAVISASAYDAMYILAEALKTGTLSDDVKKYLYTVENYPGVSGTITIDQNGDAVKDFQLMIVQNGQFVQYNE